MGDRIVKMKSSIEQASCHGYPCFMKHAHGHIVLATAPKTGVVVHPGTAGQEIGDYSASWSWVEYPGHWTRWHGTISITG